MKINKDVRVFIKYFFSAGISFAVDIILFAFFDLILVSLIGDFAIILATILARIISSLFNYYLNSRHVFKKYNKRSIFKYYALVVIQMCVSASSVYILNLVFKSIYDFIIKIVVDIIIFIINYFVQRRFIFCQ